MLSAGWGRQITASYQSNLTIDQSRLIKTSRRIMATWARLGVSLRNTIRRFWPLRNTGYGRAVGAGLLGSVVASGFIHYKNEPRWRLWPHVVYAEDAKVNKLF